MNTKEIESAIIAGDFNADDLANLNNALKVARAILSQKTTRALRVGDAVQFHNSRLGTMTFGIVEKVAIKFVNVKASNCLWKVPASMLSRVEAI
jgi:hypothetical protein